ncbi:MAG: type 4a pilus biogenesis protein PilO [Epsilonproteobacteria bacterium]|nr:type 4a pilus biogenesis protein PilO [Campylobacterota bacterium]
MRLLDSLDKFLEKRTKNERFLLLATIFVGSFALSYQYLLPQAMAFMKKERNKKILIESKLKRDLDYINSMTVNGDQEYYIKAFTKQIEELKKKLQELERQKEYIDLKMNELTYLLYNKKRWANFLYSITQKAYRNRVKIEYIVNTFLDITKEFGHVLEIEIGCNGNFKNLVGFINDLEESDLIVDIYALEMAGKNPTKLTLKVSIWGISL